MSVCLVVLLVLLSELKWTMMMYYRAVACEWEAAQGARGLGTEVPVASRDKPEVEGFWLINA